MEVVNDDDGRVSCSIGAQTTVTSIAAGERTLDERKVT